MAAVRSLNYSSILEQQGKQVPVKFDIREVARQRSFQD